MAGKLEGREIHLKIQAKLFFLLAYLEMPEAWNATDKAIVCGFLQPIDHQQVTTPSGDRGIRTPDPLHAMQVL